MLKKLLFLLFLFPTLHSTPYHKRTKTNEKKSLPVMYRKRKVNGIICTLKVEGVECGLCAQLIIDILNSYEGIENAVFKNIGLDYSESVVEFVWVKKNENISFDELQNKIEKEGFEFSFLQGSFSGLFEYKEHVDSIMQVNTNTGNIPVILDNVPERLLKKKEIMLNGKICFEQKRGYIFTLS